MSLLSAPAQLALDRLMGTPGGGDEPFTPVMFAPNIVKARDPLEVAYLLAELEDEATEVGQARNAALARRPSNEGIGQDAQGELTYNGRRCCFTLVSTLTSTIHRIPMGSEFECSCSAVYRVQRGAARHG